MRYVYTYEEFVFVTEAPTVRQNDIDRTKTDNKNRTSKQGMAIYKLTIIWTGILQQTVVYVNNPAHSALLNCSGNTNRAYFR